MDKGNYIMSIGVSFNTAAESAGHFWISPSASWEWHCLSDMAWSGQGIRMG